MKNRKVFARLTFFILSLLILDVFAIIFFAAQPAGTFPVPKPALRILEIAVCLLTVLFGVLALSLVRSIRNRIRRLTDRNRKLAEDDFSANVDNPRIAEDDLGRLCASAEDVTAHFGRYAGYIAETVETLKSVTAGHLWIQLKQDFGGEFESLKYALFGLSDTFNATLTGIAETAEQVDGGAKALSSAAQTIAQGATEQAGSIQALSASIAGVLQNVRKNAENAEKARSLSAKTEALMQASAGDMELALQAMNEISAASQNIRKIIRTIDDIAFQTNILALNAAVEAARAGSAGKGFAVVADEVRNLAGKSAEAAQNTTVLIENAISAIGKGTKIAGETAEALRLVVEKSNISSVRVAEIAEASAAQSDALTQITTGIDQISAVVQTTSATSEESAATSEELSAQAFHLKALVGKFQLMDMPSAASQPPAAYEAPVQEEADHKY